MAEQRWTDPQRSFLRCARWSRAPLFSAHRAPVTFNNLHTVSLLSDRLSSRNSSRGVSKAATEQGSATNGCYTKSSCTYTTYSKACEGLWAVWQAVVCSGTAVVTAPSNMISTTRTQNRTIWDTQKSACMCHKMVWQNWGQYLSSIHKMDTSKLSNMASVPVPVGQASGPPLDGWHWATTAWSPFGTEWSSHSHPEAGSCKRDLLCPTQEQQEEEMWCYGKAAVRIITTR